MQELCKLIEHLRKKDPLLIAADHLNRHFSHNGPAWQVLDDLRLFPRPIGVDFNNVIADNTFLPMQLNPDAPEFLRQLRIIGNVFIVTAANNWKYLHDFMTAHEIWTPDIVLMTCPTYRFLSDQERNDPNGKRLREEYFSFANTLGFDCKYEELLSPPEYKRIAPLFKKPWEIPLIDNKKAATTDNPGILGILVQEWKSEAFLGGNIAYRKLLNDENRGKSTLTHAVETVRQYYATPH